MRARWTFDPAPYIAAWFFGGLVAFLVSGALFSGCDSRGCGLNSDVLSPVSLVVLCLWIGPFVLAFAGAVVVFGGMALWAGRPRRVREPILDDLRSER